MSANIDTMVYIGEKPWHGMGIHLDYTPKTVEEIIQLSKLEWTVNTTPMFTDRHSSVGCYKAIYREDNNEVLGVVNKAYPKLVQNFEMFRPVSELLDKEVDFETVGDLGKGEKVWGCFKIRDDYKILDDEVEHYYVVFNDHTTADGKITILNTPIRVVCQNTLSAALSDAYYKLRVPVMSSSGSLTEIAAKVFDSAGNASRQLGHQAEKMVAAKVSATEMSTIMDVLFPYPDTMETTPAAERAMERVSAVREQFLKDCMGADNLNNYRGTQWQVFNALSDFGTHYFKSVDKAVDANYRMKLLKGVSFDSPVSLVDKYMRIKDKIAA